jgi:prepilin-type N-terminal cleavage/methylation domain-containing protein
MRRQVSAFTLIELLIVVAIIAILAAIAVPNFLEAQTRAKVSRVKADMRSLATAIETYVLDWNSYPPCNDFQLAGVRLTEGDMIPDDMTLERLSTPISYMTNAWLQDPFFTNMFTSFSEVSGIPGTPMPEMVGEGPQWTSLKYTSWQPEGRTEIPNGGGFSVPGPSRSWLTSSGGPDRITIAIGGVLANFSGDDTQLIIYDPTNGTVSFGDIWRVGGQSGGNPTPRAGTPPDPYGGGFHAGIERNQ